MPTTRRSTGGARARQGPAKGQSTISFSNRVSKPGVKQDLKKSTITRSKAEELPAIKPTSQDEVNEEPGTPDVVDIEVEPKEPEPVPEEKEEVPEKSEAELRAEKVTDAQIGKYWKAIEAERIAPRVHVGDLSTGEKVLRYFDVSSQYGPCVGIAREKRWQRADKLGLNPPIEVLAVLLKDEQNETANFQQAHMDEILNSTAVGSG